MNSDRDIHTSPSADASHRSSALALILAAIYALFLKAHGDEFTAAMPMSAAIRTLSVTTLGDRTLLLLALAVFVMTDVPLQRLQHAQRLKMSYHEIKANMRARMREMTMRRMTTRVPTADLVGINPTHCAVALKYDDKKVGAPRVVGNAPTFSRRRSAILRKSRTPRRGR